MLQEPHCSTRKCKHFLGIIQPDSTEGTERPCCTAFPKGIPVEISYGDNLHLKPFKGDHGILYERQEK